MDKDSLKRQVVKLQLPERVEELLLELIDGAREVNKELLNVIAEVLEMQADLYDALADVYEEESEMYEDLAEELKLMKAEGDLEQMDKTQELYEQMVKDIEAKIEAMKGQVNQGQQVQAAGIEGTGHLSGGSVVPGVGSENDGEGNAQSRTVGQHGMQTNSEVDSGHPVPGNTATTASSVGMPEGVADQPAQ